MSRTVIPGVVGPAYWAYTSLVMLRRLERIIRNKQVAPDDIPEGVYESACKFFDLVDEAVDYQSAQNLVASNNAYLIAVRALPTPHSKPSPAVLQRHSDFLKSLNRARGLEPDEIKEAIALKEFFAGLRELGSADRYVRAVHDLPSGSGLI